MNDCWTCRHDTAEHVCRLLRDRGDPRGDIWAWTEGTVFHGSGPVAGLPRRGKRQKQTEDCPGWEVKDAE